MHIAREAALSAASGNIRVARRQVARRQVASRGKVARRLGGGGPLKDGWPNKRQGGAKTMRRGDTMQAKLRGEAQCHAKQRQKQPTKTTAPSQFNDIAWSPAPALRKRWARDEGARKGETKKRGDSWVRGERGGQ